MHTDTVRAYHEAGHALAALWLGARVESLSLERAVSARTGLDLDAYCDPVYDISQPPTVAIWQRMVVAYAGPVAQADLTGRHSIEVLDEQRDDHDAVQAYAHLMQQHLGMEDRDKWRLSAWKNAIEIVTSNRAQLRAIADALTTERTLSEKRLKELAGNIAIPTPSRSV